MRPPVDTVESVALRDTLLDAASEQSGANSRAGDDQISSQLNACWSAARIPMAWMKAHGAFHAALLAGSGSSIGGSMAANLGDTAELCRACRSPWDPPIAISPGSIAA